MRKIFLLFAIVCGIVSASAQRASYMSTVDENQYEWNRSSLFAETSLGAYVGDCRTGLGWGVEAGYRWHVKNGICWDILKAGINTNLIHFSDMISVTILTGIRYNTPVLFKGKSFYANVDFGYHIFTHDNDDSGFAYEFGLGTNINKYLSLGLCWEGLNACDYYSINWGNIGIKLGVQF
jgi:hypothetical protein